MLRQNTVIERADEQDEVLILNGGTGAWLYFYGIRDGEEYLELMFFSQQDKEWRKLQLRRVGGKNS